MFLKYSIIKKTVLRDFTALFVLREADLLESVRSYLQLFQLPTESQKLDRIILEFSSHYFNSNKENQLLSDSDIIYTLVYSIIILNTDMHHPSGLKKFTLDSFIDLTLKSINHDKFPDWYVEKIFISIKDNPLEMLPIYVIKCPSAKNNYLKPINQQRLNSHALKISELMNSLILKDLTTPDFDDSFYQIFFIRIWERISNFICIFFEKTSDPSLIEPLLQILLLSINISQQCQADTAKKGFITTLIQLSQIISSTSIENLKDKNLLALLLIFKVSIHHREDLNEIWVDVILSIFSSRIISLRSISIKISIF